MTKKKYLRSDIRSMDDIENTDPITRQYWEAKAIAEANRLVQQFGNSPAVLKLVSMALNDKADMLWNKHKQELYDSKPENQRDERIKREITDRVMRELGLFDRDSD